MSQHSVESRVTRFELVVELIKALAWPIFAIFVLISFWKPLHAAVDQIPEVVNNSETITIAGMSLKIDRGLKTSQQEPSPEVRKVLASISPEGIQQLLNNGESGHLYSGKFSETANSEKARVAELVNLGLFREYSQEELRKHGENYYYGYTVSPLGIEAQEYLYAVISEFVQQLNQPAEEQ